MLKFVKMHMSMCLFTTTVIFLFVFMVLDISAFYQKQIQKVQVKFCETIDYQDFYGKLLDNARKSKLRSERTMIAKKARESINEYRSNLWRIQIPSLKLDAPISEGTSQRVLAKAVGHFEETDKWNGNVALAGHNRGYQCNFFQKIKKLEKGDFIIYCTKEGKRTYQVEINTVIEETDWQYIENTKDNRITLITCEENKREYRRCIQAIEVL